MSKFVKLGGKNCKLKLLASIRQVIKMSREFFYQKQLPLRVLKRLRKSRYIYISQDARIFLKTEI